ncbi:MAG: MBL fold metallo-hydrolase [Defluviitaleaceae bacterium]|nr:MBL fold metallo-hydrolase [Defluviitaleaceae bacterium]
MKLAQNVALLPITHEGVGSLNLVLAWDDNHLVLIDAGIPDQADMIAKAIENEGFRAEDLTHIIITHQDWDHVGSIHDLMKLAPSAKTVAHKKEAPYIDGRELPIKLAAKLEKYDSYSEENRAGLDNWKKTYTNSPIPVTEQVQDGQVLPICGGIEIVHVPGHTPGHIAVYFRESRIMVCGDAANVEDGKLVGFNPIHIHDVDMANESLEKIKGYDLNGAVTYHTGFLAYS